MQVYWNQYYLQYEHEQQNNQKSQICIIIGLLILFQH
ncbi:hypothetical protein pb186bvf_014319 [Paramecium bursaria]